MRRQDEQPVGPVLWQRPWWTRPGALAAAWTVLLLYGSLIPFDLRADRFTDLPTLLTSPRWVTPGGALSSVGLSAGTSDLVTNLVLYLPLGVLLRLVWGNVWRKDGCHGSRRRLGGVETRADNHRRSARVSAALRCAATRGTLAAPYVLALATAAGVSWGVECLQSLSPSRVGAINDFLANAGAAAAGAAVALWGREAAWSVAFATHRRFAAVTLPVLDVLRRERRRPGPRAAAMALAVLVAGWLVIEGPTASRSPGLPFVAEFSRPYDVAGVLITQALAGYMAIAGLLAVCFTRRSPAVTLVRLMLGIAAFTAAINAARWWLWGLPPNATEPILAAMAVGGLLAAAFTAVHAVRRRCRRRDATPVAVDRRRRRHDYAFAIAR